MALICDFDREIETTTREIEEQAKADDRVDVLTQIRGVGRYTAMLIIAEIGDIHRFPTARHLCSWAGLAPSVRSSDGKARLGHITRQGSPALRWALVEAAQKITTGSGDFAREIRTDRQAPRAQDRQGRCRPRDPHPGLLRTTRRRDPLPSAPQPRERERKADGGRMTHRRALTQQQGLRPRRRRDAHARASSTFLMASLTHDGRPLD